MDTREQKFNPEAEQPEKFKGEEESEYNPFVAFLDESGMEEGKERLKELEEIGKCAVGWQNAMGSLTSFGGSLAFHPYLRGIDIVANNLPITQLKECIALLRGILSDDSERSGVV